MKMNEMEDVANTYMNKFKEASDAGGLMNYMDQQSELYSELGHLIYLMCLMFPSIVKKPVSSTLKIAASKI